MMHRIKILLGALALFGVFVLVSRTGTQSAYLSGTTMGTTYSIRFSDPLSGKETAALETAVKAELAAVNRAFSLWQPDSELSRFNEAAAGEPFRLSPDFAELMRTALELCEATGGAFDPTAAPLIKAWGFGPDSPGGRPSPAKLATARALTGWEQLRLDGDRLTKINGGVTMDLAAIAKGYGVDRVSRVIQQAGITNFLVEIGGEVYAQGHNPARKPWNIGIENPAATGPLDRIQGKAELRNKAFATSGDYRNRRTDESGQSWSHIIDPRTGRPADTDLAAVCVLAGSCTEADAMATALFVMGSEAASEWVENRPETEALFLIRNPDGSIKEKLSSGFRYRTSYRNTADRLKGGNN